MKSLGIIFSAIIISTVSCDKRENSLSILQKTIENIDTIKTISYDQEMFRTNPRNVDEVIQDYREMCFERLKQDSIVGVKGHWYFYSNDKMKILFEDIYDGERLLRKNNRDSAAMVFDLNKYPEFKEKPFWGHNTPFSIQHMLKFILSNRSSYKIDRLNDTLLQNIECFQIRIRLENKESMPGFLSKLIDKDGNVSNTYLLINKWNYYPLEMDMENYSVINGSLKKNFTNQKYLNLKFNIEIDTNQELNTSDSILAGFEVKEIKPQ